MESEMNERLTPLYQKTGFSLDEYYDEAYPGKDTETLSGSDLELEENVQHVNVHICLANWRTISQLQIFLR